jgi:Predicted membrane protein
VNFVRAFGATAVTMFLLDVVWLGVVAKALYAREMGTLLRPDIQWLPGLMFYALYVGAAVVFVVLPAAERHSFARAVLLGAFFGLAAYATYDLTSLALIRDFPVRIAIVDMAWGMALTAVASAAGYWAVTTWGTVP